MFYSNFALSVGGKNIAEQILQEYCRADIARILHNRYCKNIVEQILQEYFPYFD
jgi:rRNA maturation protein Rpf1